MFLGQGLPNPGHRSCEQITWAGSPLAVVQPAPLVRFPGRPSGGGPPGPVHVWRGLHGGPGAGATPIHRRFFDPDFYRIVIFDQRGAGRSHPIGCIENNTTEHLIEDLEKLRKELLQKKKPDWQEKEKLQELLEKQKKMMEKLEKQALDQQKQNLKDNKFNENIHSFLQNYDIKQIYQYSKNNS